MRVHARYRRWPAIAAVVVATVCAAGCGQATPAHPHQTAARPSSTLDLRSVKGRSAPDGGTVRVAEAGVSPIVDDTTGKPMASFAVVVENTSKRWYAAATSVTIRILDASGAPIRDKIEDGHYTVNLAFGSPRAAVGAQIYVSRGGAARIQVQVGESLWTSTSNDVWRPIRASGVRTQRRTGDTRWQFDLTSSYTRYANGHDVEIVLRDKNGRIVGGVGVAGLVHECSSVPPGHSRCYTSSHYPLPASTDDARTEVYVSGS